MGMEIQVDSLEDMCALMCDNVIPKRRKGMTRKEALELAMQACEKTWNEKTCKKIRKALEQKPKTGHWIGFKCYDSYSCSECDEFVGKKSKYCPNCGARMESEVRNEQRCIKRR